jgi:hypothetical protein
MSVTDDETPLAQRLAARLEELGVTTSEDQARELASAYQALEVWIRIASELAEPKLAPRDKPS